MISRTFVDYRSYYFRGLCEHIHAIHATVTVSQLCNSKHMKTSGGNNIVNLEDCDGRILFLKLGIRLTVDKRFCLRFYALAPVPWTPCAQGELLCSLSLVCRTTILICLFSTIRISATILIGIRCNGLDQFWLLYHTTWSDKLSRLLSDALYGHV